MKECPYGYRKIGDVSIHCKKLEGERFTQCAHQFFCPASGRWEISPKGRECPLAKEKQKRPGKGVDGSESN